MDIYEVDFLDNDQVCLKKCVSTNPTAVHKEYPDFPLLQPSLGWLSPDIIRKTFPHTTQYLRVPIGIALKRDFKSPSPDLYVTPCDEPVARDIVYTDVLANDNDSDA